MKDFEINLGKFKIGKKNPPFVIAEMSGNHNHSLDRALKIVDAASEAGAHALKLQTYTADTMTIDLNRNEFSIRDPKSLWNGRSLYDLYKEAATPWDWHKTIFDRCREKGMIGFSTPFDSTAVEFLEKLEVPLYKVASFEMTDHSLLKKIGSTKKPVIMSTGMATASEIEEALKVLRNSGATEIVILKCTSTYPATPKDTNLITIPDMAVKFSALVGLSDHTMGLGVAVGAVTLGAVAIEKHFTLNRAEGGVDSAFSAEPHELQALITETQRAWEAIGQVSYGPTNNEKPSLQFRRSIYVVEDLKEGEVLSSKNIRIIRPGFGLEPKHYDELLGKTVRKNIERGTPLSWELVK